MAAQQKQGYCELPGSRVGMRFPLVQHPGTQCRCKEKWRRLLKSSALCSLFCLCLCGSNKIGPRWECKNSYRTKCLLDQESSGTVGGGWSRVGPTSSSWQGEVTHGSFAFGVLGAAFGALCNSSFCQGPEQRGSDTSSSVQIAAENSSVHPVSAWRSQQPLGYSWLV